MSEEASKGRQQSCRSERGGGVLWGSGAAPVRFSRKGCASDRLHPSSSGPVPGPTRDHGSFPHTRDRAHCQTLPGVSPPPLQRVRGSTPRLDIRTLRHLNSRHRPSPAPASGGAAGFRVLQGAGAVGRCRMASDRKPLTTKASPFLKAPLAAIQEVAGSERPARGGFPTRRGAGGGARPGPCPVPVPGPGERPVPEHSGAAARGRRRHDPTCGSGRARGPRRVSRCASRHPRCSRGRSLAGPWSEPPLVRWPGKPRGGRTETNSPPRPRPDPRPFLRRGGRLGLLQDPTTWLTCEALTWLWRKPVHALGWLRARDLSEPGLPV